MSQKIKLDRQNENAVKARHDDSLYLHEYTGTWIVLADGYGNNVLRIYDVSDAQLASLHAAIGRRLGLAPEPTIEHLRQLHRHLDEILKREGERNEQAMLASLDGPLGQYRSRMGVMPPGIGGPPDSPARGEP